MILRKKKRAAVKGGRHDVLTLPNCGCVPKGQPKTQDKGEVPSKQSLSKNVFWKKKGDWQCGDEAPRRARFH